MLASNPDQKAAKSTPVRLPLALTAVRPGARLAVAVSGGADSVALLRLVAHERAARGLVLTVIHVHHGIRGAEADADAAFVRDLAKALALPFLQHTVNTPVTALNTKAGLEETARNLRYRWFHELLSGGGLDAVATAHTLNDQAETVLHKLIRGAWTEGLSGIHPVVRASPGSDAWPGLILRPLLEATRKQVTDWLEAIGQPWREDATNMDLAYTRNRIRHTLLPELATYNPQIATQLARVATLAREEEAYWGLEVARVLPGLLLPGRPVRGGGRASSTIPGEKTLAVEVERLRSYPPALVRRMLRGAARQLGVTLDFEQTARLTAMVGEIGPNGTQARGHSQREELTGELRAERTPRELRLVLTPATRVLPHSGQSAEPVSGPVSIPVPGEGSGFGWRLHCSFRVDPVSGVPRTSSALLRTARPGDRVQLRNSSGAPKRIKEVFERMRVPAGDRPGCPVLEFQGEILWMAGADLEPSALTIRAEKINE